jgi:hypothetical protein
VIVLVGFRSKTYTVSRKTRMTVVVRRSALAVLASIDMR